MDKSKLITKRGNEILQDVERNSGRGEELAQAMVDHINRFHTLNEIRDNDIEETILLEELENIRNPKKPNFKRGIPTFSPSSASKMDRELYYKAKRYPKDETEFLPYQRRWVRNGTAVHRAVQKDLLLAEEHLKDPAFKVAKMPDGSAMWEDNVKDVKQFEYDGEEFQIFGMMDGILEYRDGSKIGFEFKTKSTTISAVGNFLMKDAQDGHKQQAIAYSLLFGVDEFIFLYESVAKDGWMKGEEAKSDLRAFYFKPTQEQKDELLAKFARVTRYVNANELPPFEPDGSNWTFFAYKEQMAKDGGPEYEAFMQELADKEEARKRKAEAKKAKKGAK